MYTKGKDLFKRLNHFEQLKVNIKKLPCTDDPEELCKSYGCKLNVRFAPRIKKTSGWYDNYTKEIVIFPAFSQKDVNTESNIVFCHELAHRIQSVFYGIFRYSFELFDTYWDLVLYEREACRLSYFIYLAYFLPHNKDKILHHCRFKKYRSKKVINSVEKLYERCDRYLRNCNEKEV